LPTTEPPSSGLRFALLTYGSRGDVEPFLALALGLKQAGHKARLTAPGSFAPLAQRHEVDFSPLEGNPEDLAQALTDRAGLSGPRMVARMIEHVMPIAASVLSAVRDSCRDCDVIIHSFLMTEAGHMVAHERGLADFSAQLFPVFAPTSEFPGVVFPDVRLGRAYRMATHRLNTFVFRYGGRLLYRRLRAIEPGLPRLGPWPFTAHDGGPTPLLFGYSPLVLPQPMDWPPFARVTGYWHLQARRGWSPPPNLLEFLEAGPAPVYFGVGSMRSSRMSQVTSAVIAALAMTGQRGIVAVPRAAREKLDLPASIHLVDDVPHAWLFPRCRLVIHHGGAGTTGSALRSGVPSAALPFTADQAFWARRAHRLGVGPQGFPARRITPQRLVSMIEAGLGSEGYSVRARALGEKLRAEDGIGSALRFIHERLGLPVPPRSGARE
jgi:sterol 3beta-glucosyltransferase